MAKIEPPSNPLLAPEPDQAPDSIAVDAAAITVPSTFQVTRGGKARRGSGRRAMKELIRKESADTAAAGFSRVTDVFGITKGQFSLINLLESVIDITGPAHLTVSTWTAANADLSQVLDFIEAGRVLSARFLLDFTFQRRQPEIAHRIREVFGRGSLRVTRNHAKFFLLNNDNGWNVTCKTSMNLNQNPRLEDFDLSNDPLLWDFLNGIIDNLFSQTTGDQGELTTNELQHQFYKIGGDNADRKNR